MGAATSVHATGEVLRLDEFCPWKDHLFEVEAEQGIQGRTKYVLYPDSRAGW